MSRLSRPILLALGAMLLAGCDGAADDGVVDVAFIGNSDSPFASGLRLGPAAQHVRAATAEGLVSLNEQGEIVPGLAESWIVTDDGLSYIFRLRNTQWPDGSRVTGQSARDALIATRRQLIGTSLGHDLAKVDAVLAMAGRVIEIRLQSPMPDLLQLLAQPELGLRQDGQGIGPMTMRREGDVAMLSALPPSRRGLPENPNWEEDYREVTLRALPVEQALAAFAQGEVEVVLGGTLANLPLADTGPLSRGTVRLDPALGLFGLRVTAKDGMLADAELREALAMAIDRSDLLVPFNIAGWSPATRLAAPSQLIGEQIGPERWTNQAIEDRRGVARRRILTWRAANDRRSNEPLPVTIALPQGPGAELLLRELNADFEAIGIVLQRAEAGTRPDLRLVDRVARFPGLRWYLNQFNCALDNGACSTVADDLVAEASMASDAQQRTALLAQAEAALVDANAYIPLGSPVRWSLVRGQIDGFVENPWNLHPLFPLAQRPI